MIHTGISEQAKASKQRLEDARTLLSASRWRGAMYLAGYAVECLLKAKLMLMYGCRTLRELEDDLQRRGVLSSQATVFTHQLELLLRLTQRLAQLRQNPLLWRQFTLVNRWIPAWRYAADTGYRQDAEDFLAAVAEITDWLEHNV